jgi:ABC-type transporter Mla subunit MlaD
VSEPRDLTDLVPNEVRAELAVAVAVLEQHGPAVSEALRQLDQATTAARQALDPI